MKAKWLNICRGRACALENAAQLEAWVNTLRKGDFVNKNLERDTGWYEKVFDETFLFSLALPKKFKSQRDLKTSV